MSRLILYWKLSKPRVTLLVWFSMWAGLIIGAEGAYSFVLLASCGAGAWFVVASANGFNQVLEKDQDAGMKRTANRPIASGAMGTKEAIIISSIWGIIGILLLALFVNGLSALLSGVGHLIYTLIYTPSKRLGAYCVIPGAIAGALPPVMGWVAARGYLSTETLILFLFQFIWQLPHTWAITALNKRDFKSVGFKMTPVGDDNDVKLGGFMLFFSALLIPISLIPAFAGSNHFIYAMIAFLSGVFLVYRIGQYRRFPSPIAAKKALLATVFYLPLIFLGFIFTR